MAGTFTAEVAEAEEARLRPAIRRILRSGAALGSVLLVIGLVLLAVLGPGLSESGTTRLTSPELRAAVLSPSPTGLLVLGVVALALTPLSRVALAAGIFAAARDRPLLAVSTFVMLVLAATVVIGVIL